MTRVIIEELANPANSLTLVSRSVSITEGPDGGDEWFLRTDGLDDGWYAPPDGKDDGEDDPSGDGTFWPDEYRTSSRAFPIRGGLWTRASSLGQSAARARLARLHNRPLSIYVEDEGGPRWVYGFCRQQPKVSRPSIYRVEFTLFVFCPDPVKLGREVRFPASGGVAQVENGGDYPTWPTIYTQGQTSVVAVDLDGQLVAWSGSSASGVVIDTRNRIVKNGNGQEIGGMRVDDVFRIPPGAHELSVESDAPVRVGVRPGWL